MYFNKTGILQIEDTRLAVRPLRVNQYPDRSPEIILEVIPNVFCESNLISKAKSILNDIYGAKSSKIKDVIFNDPATIVIWSDGSKTVVKCQPDDEYNKETGLAMCIAKKFLGNKGNFNEVFKKYIEDYDPRESKKG